MFEINSINQENKENHKNYYSVKNYADKIN